MYFVANKESEQSPDPNLGSGVCQNGGDENLVCKWNSGCGGDSDFDQIAGSVMLQAAQFEAGDGPCLEGVCSLKWRPGQKPQ